MRTLEQLGISPAQWTAVGGHWVEFGDYAANDDWGRWQTFAIPDSEEAPANARLIAAAPELYEALEECERKLDACDPYCNLLGRVRAALAMAGGEEAAK